MSMPGEGPTAHVHVRLGRLLTDGAAAAQRLVGQPLHTTLPSSLLWAAGVFFIVAPLTVWKLRRS
jgi:hypothetical protein